MGLRNASIYMYILNIATSEHFSLKQFVRDHHKLAIEQEKLCVVRLQDRVRVCGASQLGIELFYLAEVGNRNESKVAIGEAVPVVGVEGRDGEGEPQPGVK